MEENFLNLKREDSLITEEEIKLEALLHAKKQREEKHAVKMAAAYIGFAYFLQLAVPYVFSFLLVVVSSVTGFANEINTLLSDSAFVMVLQIFLSLLAFIPPYLLIGVGVKKKVTQLIDFGKPKQGTFLPTVLMGLGFCTFGNLVTNTISSLFSLVGIRFSSPDFIYPEGIFGSLLSLIAVAVTPALVEEFAMRGMVMGSLKTFGKGFAIMVSAAIFALMHGNLVQIPFAFTVGLALGFAVVKSGSIWTAVVIHFLNNGLSFLLDLLFGVVTDSNMQDLIMIGYFAAFILCFFVGLLLSSRKKDFWKGSKTEITLSVGQIAATFFFSPVIIVDIIITFFCCLEYISI